MRVLGYPGFAGGGGGGDGLPCGARTLSRWGPMKPVAPCVLCRHLDLAKTKQGPPSICAAFPPGVPPLIAQGLERHETPYPGDHGIPFDERNDWSEVAKILEAE